MSLSNPGEITGGYRNANGSKGDSEAPSNTSNSATNGSNTSTPNDNNEKKSRKANGALTEPTLPPKTIASKDGVEIVHYTKSGDHGPPHLHVKGSGQETRIGQNGKPLKNNPVPSGNQQSVIDEYKGQIRSAVKKIGAWFNYNQQ